MSFEMLLITGFLFGIGFGYFVQRAGLCFALGLGEIFCGRGKRICQMFSVIFIITAIGFLISGFVSPSLGLKPIGVLRGYGLFNVLSGVFFGAGILLNGGCILGTLRRIGEGDMTFFIVLLSFIPGMMLIVHVVDPLMNQLYNPQKILLPELLNTSAALVTYLMSLLVLIGMLYMRKISANKKVQRKFKTAGSGAC